jgi:hypothetical protein
MIQTIRIAPRNSLLLIMDPAVGEIPESMDGGLVAVTSSCVAVGTRSEVDGETLISLSDEASQAETSLFCVFHSHLDTPTRRIAVCSVSNEALLHAGVAGSRTALQIWVNHQSEPDEIRVLILKTSEETGTP